jgi:hypothetical protein
LLVLELFRAIDLPMLKRVVVLRLIYVESARSQCPADISAIAL